MGTNNIFFLFMLFSSIFRNIESLNTSQNCSDEGPDILSPFSLHSRNCSYQDFQLLCQQNQTQIRFPFYGDLVVKSISYHNKMLNLLDPKNCVHEVFLNLDLSHTPFDYYYVLKNYTYLNCSSQLSPMFLQVPCLSGPEYHVYVVESFEELPSFCRIVKTIGIPFSYSPYLSDNSFGLGFTWDLKGYEDCGMIGEFTSTGLCKVLGVISIIFMAAILIGVNAYWSKVAWDYSVANVNEAMEEKGGSIHRNEKNGGGKEILYDQELV